MDTIPDNELLRAYARDHDQEAFAVLLARYQRLVRAACRRQAPPGAEDDCMQAVFLVLARRPAAAAAAPVLPAWLLRVAAFTCRRAQRAAARRARAERAAPVPASAPPPATEDDRLERALARLGARERVAIVRSVVDGEDAAVIAAQLGITRNHVHQLVHRGLERLRRQLTQRRTAPLTAGMLAALLAARAEGAETAQVLPLLTAEPTAHAHALARAVLATLARRAAAGLAGTAATVICAVVLGWATLIPAADETASAAPPPPAVAAASVPPSSTADAEPPPGDPESTGELQFAAMSKTRVNLHLRRPDGGRWTLAAHPDAAQEVRRALVGVAPGAQVRVLAVPERGQDLVTRLTVLAPGRQTAGGDSLVGSFDSDGRRVSLEDHGYFRWMELTADLALRLGFPDQPGLRQGDRVRFSAEWDGDVEATSSSIGGAYRITALEVLERAPEAAAPPPPGVEPGRPDAQALLDTVTMGFSRDSDMTIGETARWFGHVLAMPVVIDPGAERLLIRSGDRFPPDDSPAREFLDALPGVRWWLEDGRIHIAPLTAPQ